MWRSGYVMDYHAIARGSIPGGNGIITKLHVLCKGQLIGMPSLNDLAVYGTLNTTNLPFFGCVKCVMHDFPYSRPSLVN